MDERTAIDFNNDILSTNSFICCSCNSILKCPIILMDNVGNMCNDCYIQDKESHVKEPINNTSLEVILKKMYFPCENKDSGCLQSIKYIDKQEHELSCEFKSIKCNISDSCDWKGIKQEIINHIFDSHKEIILFSQNSKFSGELNLSKACKVTFILKTTSTFIFVLMKSQLKVLYKLVPLTGSVPENIFLKISDNNKNHLKLMFKKSSKAEYNEIDVDILSRLFNLDEILKWAIEMETCPEDANAKPLDGSMLSHFECPVCRVYMKPPIFQCSAGHSVCSSCKFRLERCPTCRGFFGNTRNYSLEGLTSRIPYPCIYENQGCKEFMLAKDLVTHELSCTYQPHSCFFPGCNFAGHRDVPLIKHLTVIHHKTVFNKNIQNFTMNFYLEKAVGTKKYGMIVDNYIFKFVYKQSLEHTFWGVEVVSPSTPNSNFVYEMCLIDEKKSERTLIRTDVCLRQVSEEVIFRKCVALPNNIVHSFANNGTIKFYIKINKSQLTHGVEC